MDKITRAGEQQAANGRSKTKGFFYLRTTTPELLRQQDASPAPTIQYPDWPRRTLRPRPLYPKLHCAKAILYFGWRPDHPYQPPTALAARPLQRAWPLIQRV
jgi:hypothetical protein